MKTLLTICAAALLMAALPSSATAQESYPCRWCNELTKNCDTNHASGNVADECREHEFQGEDYCANFGIPSLFCDQQTNIGIDGVRHLPPTLPGGAQLDLVASLSVDDPHLRDCRGRIVALRLTPQEARTRRKVTAKITI